MKKRILLLIATPIFVVIGLLVWYLSSHSIAVLSPAGQISSRERHLMLFTIILAAIVVIPVYTLTILIAFKYRESNEKAKYSPEWDSSRLFETIWWTIPLVIITILSVITWNSSHSLDPYKPVASKTKAINVEVVALDWKWLFIYPDQHLASVNELDIPVNTPINLYITSDTVMNSLWIPRLSGQIYAMPGMQTQLHIVANKTGSFYGSSANISGKGFASMNFMTHSLSPTLYKNRMNNVMASRNDLNSITYAKLAKSSTYNPVSYYSNVSNGLFDSIMSKYMAPGMNVNDPTMSNMSGMNS